jgi:hypothetical protein
VREKDLKMDFFDRPQTLLEDRIFVGDEGGSFL